MPASSSDNLRRLNREIVNCHKCPRLVAWREEVAHEKVARFSHCEYWGKPVPAFGDPAARVLIVGLAPAAHGANRTGRMFTGDRSGEWLYRALHKFRFSNEQVSISPHDNLRLRGCYITAVLRCAPPLNKPLKEEIEHCQPYLRGELAALKDVRVIVALGKIAFDRTIITLEEMNMAHFGRRPKFAHGARWRVNDNLTLIASYHPSQQNTFTGKLTAPMFDSIFRTAREILKEGKREKLSAVGS